MLEVEVLIVELPTVDRVTTTTVTALEITTLDHEVADDSMEFGALVTEAFLAGSESAEILSSARDVFAV